VKGLTRKGRAGRLIIVYIGLEKGFLTWGLLIYKAEAATGDYHGQMNAENFEKWMSSQVLPNLPPGSVVVMDNVPCYGKQVDKVPSKYSVKADMIGWLERRGVAASLSVRENTLIELINAHKPAEKLFSVDVLLKNHGHTEFFSSHRTCVS
jgi:hypothetical protein